MAKPNTDTTYTGLEIAIIGMAGSFPGATGIDEFWRNLEKGVESISFFSSQELMAAGFEPEHTEHPDFVKAMATMEGKEYFDADFFAYLDQEAQLMDPQMRVFHQTVWTALEDAAYNPDSYPGQIGLYAGAGSSLNWEAFIMSQAASQGIDTFYSSQLQDKDFMPLRIAYKLNLKGPSVFVKTACSTALVAVHTACRALLTGDCNIAIAGAVSVKNRFKGGYLYREGLTASPDGHCRSFDVHANGTVSGEGSAAVVLKKLKNALADNDNIHAIIKGSAVNNDGLRKAGFTAPSVDGQAEAIRKAHKMARIEPQSIGYIEANGTGTALGDSVELAALREVFGDGPEKYCALGSVKTNIGHLDEAAGAAGLIKTVLALKHKSIPPSLHFTSPNPGLELETSPFYVNTRLTPWTATATPLRAGVSAFGIGGNNAHLILEAAPPQEPVHLTERNYLFVLSARSPRALDVMTENLKNYFKSHPGIAPSDAAFTLQTGRKVFQWRRFWVCKSIEEAAEILSQPQGSGACMTMEAPKSPQKPAFVKPASPEGSHDFLRDIGMQWLQGAHIDWREFHGDITPRRISLPVYPFEKTPYPVAVDAYKLLSGALPEDPAKPAVKQRPELDTAFAEPSTPMEKRLAVIWQEVLNIDRVGREDNFFSLGGQSLKATTAVSKIHKDLDVKIQLTDIFKFPSISELAASLEQKSRRPFQAIQPAEKKQYYPLSPAQTRLFTLYNLGKRNIAYNMPLVYFMRGEVDKEAIHHAALELIQRHESFRTSFQFVDDVPAQRVWDMEDIAFKLEYNEPESGEETKVYDKMVRAFIRPFDLSRAPLLRVGLVKTGEDQFMFMVDTHHILSDGVTHSILVNDFMALYTGSPLEPLPLQYKDYSVWQGGEIMQARLKQQEAFWLDRFSGNLPVLNLPNDFARPAMQKFDGHRTQFSLSEQQTVQLKGLLEGGGTTLFVLLLSLFNVTLHKITAQEDIVVGTGAAGRGRHDLERIAGLFVNTLALRNYPRPGLPFKEFLAQVKEHTLEAFENQEYPFETLVDKAAPRRDTSRNPLFDVMLVLQNIDAKARQFPGWDIELELFQFDVPISKFDITLFAEEIENRLVFTLEYSTVLFSANTMDLFRRFFQETIDAAIAAPGNTIAELTQIPPERKQEMIDRLNSSLDQQARAIESLQKPLQQRLEDAFNRFGDHIALVDGTDTVTYGELHRRSLRVAQWLMKEKSIRPGDLIAVLTDRRIHMIIAMISILRTGALFVPLDSSLPDERLKLMLEKAEASALFCGRENRQRLETLIREEWIAPGQISLINWDHMMDLDMTELEKNLENENASAALPASYSTGDHVYLYFTSGSTGTPRAMVGRNGALLHFIDWQIQTFNIDENYRFSQLTSPVFDAFLRDVLTPLCGGGRICVPPDKETAADPARLGVWLEETGVTIVHTVPGIFRVLTSTPGASPKRFPSLRYILLSGERLNPADLEKWYRVMGERIALVNLWGTSETTMAKTFYFVSASDVQRERIPVGKPLPGARVAVLNPEMELCDTLVNGELYIKTPFRTAGYYKDPEAEKQRFIPDPFGGSGILHRTGDIGRVLADGSIDVSGRNDRQVKIRGIRVELEEIESVAAANDNVSEAVALLKNTGGGNQVLCAYFVLPQAQPEAEESQRAGLETKVKRYMEQRLPSYMVPSHFIFMDAFPRRASGKVDYDALPDPLAGLEDKGPDASRRQPADEIEEQLLALWSEILGLSPETIAMDRDFFQLGGHSLNAITLNSRIQRQFQVPIEVGQIFANPSIETQAVVIRDFLSGSGGEAQARNEKYMSINPVEKRVYYPLSPAQKRLYILYRMDPNAVNYNMFNMVPLDGYYDVARLDDVCRKLIQRHEGLRTTFHMRGKMPVQRIHDNDIVNFIFEYDNVEGLSLDNGEAGHTEVVRNFIRPFDLSKAPLFRAGLVKVQKEKYILLVDLHHIISDGMSHDIFVSEALHLYARPDTPLPVLRLQYKDYATWVHERMESGEFARQEKYWLDCFKQPPPVLDLPLDFPRPRFQDYNGRNLPFIIPETEAGLLRELARREGATMFMVVLALLQFFLSRLTGQRDIIVGTVSSGRGHQDLERIIGMFVNTLVLRGYPTVDKTFVQLVREARDSTRGAFAHQEYPFEDLVEKIVKKRETSRNPLFDVMYSFTAYQPGRPVPPPSQADDRPFQAKFDLLLSGADTGQFLQMNLGYRTSLFKPETIERFSGYFTEIALAAANNEHMRLDDFVVSSQLAEAGTSGFEEENSEFDF